MRLEVIAAEAGNGPPAAGRGRPRLRIDAVELGVLAVFALLSLWTGALDLYQAHHHGLVWTGTDGVYIVDQLQYLSWIRSASHHLLSANLFVLRGTPADYFQPAVLVSAGLTAAGIAPYLALLVWKPVAVVCTFFAFRAYMHRSLPGTTARRAALILAIFYGSATLVYGSWSVIGDLMPTFLSWGYTFGLLAIGLMVLALVLYDRVRERDGLHPLPGLLAAVAALLHPWQGELLVLIILVSEIVMWGVRRQRPTLAHLRAPVLTLVLACLPLLYYLILGHADLSWKLARVASKHAFSLWSIVLALVPLALPALLALRPRRLDFLEVVTRVWVAGAVAVFVFSSSALSATPLHAFDAITVPLAVLAVQGVTRLGGRPLPRSAGWLRSRWLLVAALGVLTVPATAYLMNYARKLAAPTGGNPNFIRKQERAALRYLAHAPQRGGVLTRFYLGVTVPPETGRRTFVGDCLWSQPGCGYRASATQALLDGKLTPARARQFVRATRARFVLSDCDEATDLTQTLAPLLVSVHRFGCAAVYELQPSTAAGPPLAESELNAALRASGRQ